MDTETKKKREINPRENANILSVLLFIFAFKTIRKGVHKDLQNDDIYEILNDYRSEKLGNQLEIRWKKELKKPKPIFLRPILRIFWAEYVLLGVLLFIIDTILMMSEPIFTGKLVSYFEPNTNLTKDTALMYAGGLIACQLGYMLFDHTFLLFIQQLSMKIRISCCSLLYRKCLKLNLYNSPQFATGTVVTLMSKDVMQFEAAIDLLLVICSGTVQVFIMTYLMYMQIGVAALYGASLLLVLLPLQELMAITDAHVLKFYYYFRRNDYF